LNHFALLPRVLVDVRQVDLRTTLLDRPLASPILIASGALQVPSSRVRGRILDAAVDESTAIVAESDAPIDGVPPELLFRAVHWKELPTGPEAGRVLAAGVRSAADAQRAIAGGARAVLISNVTAQPDSGASSLDLLPAIRKSLPADVSLVLEGSFRHGNEILIALGLGAAAVVIGWPVVWGAVATGENGVRRALQILQLELVRGLRLCGRPVLQRIGPDLVRLVPELGTRVELR
jgi:isopentenyl diphosphate isomerase/L-lactate dehydrogenase-like FMN-dependent dehydrogenase